VQEVEEFKEFKGLRSSFLAGLEQSAKPCKSLRVQELYTKRGSGLSIASFLYP
jgi:hypothetical protein